MPRRGMRRAMILPLALFLMAAIWLGLAAGLRLSRLDESTVIDRVGRDWIASGGRAEDCVARPGQGRVWLVVTCGAGPEARVRAFHRWGFEIAPGRSDDI